MPVTHTHVTAYWVGLLEREVLSIHHLRKLFDGCDWCKKKINSLVERAKKFGNKKARRVKVGLTGEDHDRLYRYRTMMREHRERERKKNGLGRKR